MFFFERRHERTCFIRENKGPDQLCGSQAADQRLCFRYIDSTIPLLPNSDISSLLPSSVAVQPGVCRTWLETPNTGFLMTRLICIKAMTTGLVFDNDIVLIY